LLPGADVSQANSQLSKVPVSKAPRLRVTKRGQPGPNEALQVICIDTGGLPAADRDAVMISADEQLAWLACAAQCNSALVVLLTDNAIEFYTIGRDRANALRPVLETFAARILVGPELGMTRMIEHTGHGAARHLLKCAAGLVPAAPGAQRSAVRILRAVALSPASKALGGTLGPLFRAAANVGRRVRRETLLKGSGASPALREVEVLAAERIVEEEFAIWQMQQVA
jgi:glutamyl-tRNA reductase